MITYPILSQRDPRWANKSIGYSSETLGQYGCLYMDLLMLVCHDRDFIPAYIDSLMGCMKDHGNYTPASGAYLASFDVSQCCPPEWGSVTCKHVTGVYNGPFPPELLDALFAWLVHDPAIIEVDPTPGSPGIGDGNTHFVLAVGVNRIGTIQIHDPWYGDVVPLCPRYGPDPATAIYRSIAYEIAGPNPMEAP